MENVFEVETMVSKLRKTDDGCRSSRNSSTVDCGTVLTVLEDPDCRTLLEATTDEALTAGELTEHCEIPRSTTYRKLERLTEAGLLEERVRLSSDGKHASEYRRTVDDITISLGDANGITIGLSSTATTPETAD